MAASNSYAARSSKTSISRLVAESITRSGYYDAEMDGDGQADRTARYGGVVATAKPLGEPFSGIHGSSCSSFKAHYECTWAYLRPVITA